MTSAVPVLTQAEMSVWADPVSAPGLPEPMLQVPPLLQGEVDEGTFCKQIGDRSSNAFTSKDGRAIFNTSQ